MKKLLGFAEQGFAVVSLLLYSGGPLTVLLSGGADEGELTTNAFNNSLVLLLLSLNYVVTFFLLIAQRKKVLYLLSKDRLLSIVLGLAVVSILWSVNPAKTVNRSIALVGTSLFGLYLATRYNMRQQLQVLAWMFGIAIVLSFLFGVALPKYGIMGGIHAGAWRGIYNHKNVLGKVMVPSAIVFFLLAISSKRNRLLLWCSFSSSLVLILLSTSKTSLLNVVTLLAALAVYRLLRWRYDLMIPALTGIATVGGGLQVWLTANADTLLSAIGKDATLTGRTDLWPFVWEMIWKSPWLGYGYGAFWYGLDSESAYIWYATGWTPPNAHNGLLDLLLNLGFLGLTIFVLGFFTTSLPSALAWVRLSRRSEGFWPVIYITYFVLANLAESTLMIQNDIFWVLYVAVSFSVLMPPERQTKVLV
jgi:O-antigen ligase